MTHFTRQIARMSVAMGAGLVLAISSVTLAQTTAPADAPAPRGPQQGQIKGDNVYVRSGSHQHYYPVTKLNRGDAVTVVGEQYGWLEILPVDGCFSLVEKTYVDRAGDTGTINEDRWTFAGSNLDNRRYAKQVKLKKGDTVQVLGETQDGAFLKIAPPEGAHLWVKADFVDGVAVTGARPPVTTPETVVPGSLDLDAESATGTTSRPAGVVATRPAGNDGIVMRPSIPVVGRTTPRNARSKDKPGPVRATEKYQAQIDAIEAEMAAIRGKPGNESGYQKVVSKLEPIAEQKEDEVAALYATHRVRQIRAYLDAQAGVRRIDELKEEALRNAERIAAERSTYKVKTVNPLDEIVVRGEIRVSTIYEGTAGRAKRWRVVEPGSGFSARTLAYIELPPDSPIDPVAYYGKHIGIRAIARQVLSDANPPLPIYTVSEIVVLDSDSRSRDGKVGGTSAYASPPSRSVAPPTSQPAEETSGSSEPAAGTP